MSHHYVQYESLNRYVIRMLWQFRMTGCWLAGCSTLLGRPLRMPGCETRFASLARGDRRERPSAAIVMLTWWRRRCTCQWCRMARDHAWPYTPADTSWMLFALWCGANASCRTAEMWRGCRDCRHMIRAAQFKTRCSLSNCCWLQVASRQLQ